MILMQFELMLLVFTRITNSLLEFYTRKTHEYKCPVNTRACMHASKLVDEHLFVMHAQAREGTLASKGIEHVSLDRGEQENKPFARELVHASIKLEMSCTV